ncbi:MAG: MoaD/ThiS family protein [Chloroflexota bacterium]
MEIQVRLYASLRQYRPPTAGGLPHHPFIANLPAGSAVDAVVALLGIPEGLVNAAAVNGEAVELTTPLQPDDQVSLFPAAAGG